MVDRRSAGQAGAACKDSWLAAGASSRTISLRSNSRGYVPSWTAASPLIVGDAFRYQASGAHFGKVAVEW